MVSALSVSLITHILRVQVHLVNRPAGRDELEFQRVLGSDEANAAGRAPADGARRRTLTMGQDFVNMRCKCNTLHSKLYRRLRSIHKRPLISPTDLPELGLRELVRT